MKNRQILHLALTLLLVLSLSISAGEVGKIELKQLEGKWVGDGFLVLPVAETKLDIEGEANFVYDAENNRLRSSLLGEKLFFTYKDSGYITIIPETDSISWEVWDNFGKHALYFGTIDGNKISADRMRKKDLYQLTVVQIHADTINFELTVTPPGDETYHKAKFHLWRVED